VYTARNRDQWGFDLRRLRRRPLGAQGDAIRAVAVSLRRHRGTNLVGEMGTGKTTIGTAALSTGLPLVNTALTFIHNPA
jgi:ABC-type microcin C transport system duplicated ATPase subunit YejF